MKTFNSISKVRVTNPDEERAALRGKTGTVVRLLIRDQSAWVIMDEPIPETLARFPKGDERHTHVNLWPDECEPAKKRP